MSPGDGYWAGSGLGPSPSPVDELARRIAGLLIVGFRGERLADAPWVRTAIARDGLGGVILFDRDQLTGRARNVASPAQTAALKTRQIDGMIVEANGGYRLEEDGSGLRDGAYSDISDDVIRPSAVERHANPRSTAAKLRWARRSLS